MDKYEHVMMVGEGSYGVVMKCRHKELDQMVAIKKFLETEEDATIRKMALREIRMLRRLKHENLVTIIEVFRYRKRFYLVFEFLNGTILDELEHIDGGLGEETCRERLFQIIRAISYCHTNQIIHRDVKPENVLVSSLGVVKLCDFGFARLTTMTNEPFTDYVATRWYRAPELLVGDQNYGPGVDIWAIGCLFAEMLSGDPLFPGDSDIDQLYLIVKMLGKPCVKHQTLMSKNTQLKGMLKSASSHSNILQKTFNTWPAYNTDLLLCCLKMDPTQRSSADELLRHTYFTHDNFPQSFLVSLRDKVVYEFNTNPLLRKVKSEILHSSDRHDEQRSKKTQTFTEQIRWKFHFNEGTAKRKFHEAGGDATMSDKHFMNLNKVGQKLAAITKHSQRQTTVQACAREKLKPVTTPKILQNANNAAEMQMLEKSLESLAKLNQTSDFNRALSAQKERAPSNVANQTASPDSPRQFQSLQPHFSYFDQTKLVNHLNVLHPSINNINFTTKGAAKKSPTVLQCVGVYPTRTTTSQVSLGYNRNFLKKLDRNGVAGDGATTLNAWDTNSQATTLISAGNLGKKKDQKSRNSDFTLPNLPGATATPNKSKKKHLSETDQSISDSVTPAYRYSKAKRKYNITDIAFH